jgi:hypothetical protein
MILDSIPIAAEERLRNATIPTATIKGSGRGAASAAPVSDYSRVMDEVSAAQSSEPAVAEKPASTSKPFSLWEHEDFGFADFLDIINPLQHIPIVSTIYRNLTGDQIAMAPRVIGGAIWGRLGGFVSGVINSVVEWFTGKDLGDHIYAALFGQPGEQPADNAVAQAADVKPLLPDNSPVEIVPAVDSPASAKVEAEAVPTAVPLTSTDAPIDQGRLHSAITPTGLISSHYLRSLHRYDDDRNTDNAKQPKVRLSA